MDTSNYVFATNNNFVASLNSNLGEQTGKKDIYINYQNFQNSYRWETGESIYNICPHCGKEKCSCGGCPRTNFDELIRKFKQAPKCQRCICHQVEFDLVNNTLNSTGKSLDELVKEQQHRGKRLKPVKKITIEDYEKGAVIKQGNDFIEVSK